MINTIYSIGTKRKNFAFIAWLGISVIFIFQLSIPVGNTESCAAMQYFK